MSVELRERCPRRHLASELYASLCSDSELFVVRATLAATCTCHMLMAHARGAARALAVVCLSAGLGLRTDFDFVFDSCRNSYRVLSTLVRFDYELRYHDTIDMEMQMAPHVLSYYID